MTLLPCSFVAVLLSDEPSFDAGAVPGLLCSFPITALLSSTANSSGFQASDFDAVWCARPATGDALDPTPSIAAPANCCPLEVLKSSEVAVLAAGATGGAFAAPSVGSASPSVAWMLSRRLGSLCVREAGRYRSCECLA